MVLNYQMLLPQVGLQRDIIIFICHECKNSRSRITEALTLEHMAMSLKRSTGAIRTTIQRLEKKGCLLRAGFKNGRGGWSRYELPDSIYHDVLRSETSNKVATEPKTKWQQSSNKVAVQNQNPQQSGNQTSNTIRNKVATNPQQSGNKVATKMAFSELVGWQDYLRLPL